MDFENLAKTWENFGKEDPLWAILSWEGRKDNRWDLGEFFRSGEAEIGLILQQAETRKKLTNKGKSLDFGCGVGRLTFPLARTFGESHGVDISEPMIARANQFKAERQVDNCVFHLNRKQDLSLLPSSQFDFILSLIVLQHMEPTYFLTYIAEFVRLLKKDGLLVFQLPDKIEERAAYMRFTDKTEPTMEMYGAPKDQIARFLKQKGGTVLDVAEDQSCGVELKSYRYFVTK